MTQMDRIPVSWIVSLCHYWSEDGEVNYNSSICLIDFK